MKEIKKPSYPSQNDAEFVAELLSFLDSSFRGGITTPIADVFKKLEHIRIETFEYAFGKNSPWKYDARKKGSRRVIWDDKKAAKLGIE